MTLLVFLRWERTQSCNSAASRAAISLERMFLPMTGYCTIDVILLYLFIADLFCFGFFLFFFLQVPQGRTSLHLRWGRWATCVSACSKTTRRRSGRSTNRSLIQNLQVKKIHLNNKTERTRIWTAPFVFWGWCTVSVTNILHKRLQCNFLGV